MAFRNRTAVVLYFLATLNWGLGYETYIVERDCSHSGNISINMGSGDSNSAVLLQAAENGDTYSLSMDCKIAISAPKGNKILVAIRQLDFRSNFGRPCKDYIKIGTKVKCEKLFREDEERHFMSDGNAYQLNYHISRDGMHNTTQTGHIGFKVTITAVMEKESCSSSDDIYECDNYYCIWTGLRCDTHNNCGDLSDESDCGVNGGRSTMVLIILGSLILLLLIIMCATTLLCTKNENVRRFSNRLRSRTLSYLPRFSR